MKKKLVMLLSGAAAVAGFALVTGFGGMTKAQQMTAIEEKVTANLATLRETKTKECDDRVAATANTKAQEVLAAEQEPIKQGIGPGKPVKKPTKGNTKGGTKVDPLPNPSKPAEPDSKSKWNSGGEKPATESQSKWQKPADGSAPAKPAESKSKWKKKEDGGK